MTESTEKTFHFITGLPRSGSTLLCNILNQNPRFHATPTSGVLGLLVQTRNAWNRNAAFAAVRNEPAKLRVLRSMLYAFYADVEQPVIFDKNRGWSSHFEMIEFLLGHKVKMLVTVRDIRDVLASFEKLWRKEARTGQTPQEKQYPQEFKTIVGRCEVLMKSSQPVGDAYNRMKDSFLRGFKDQMHIIEFEKLTADPEKVMREVYTFLEEEYYPHDFTNVEQTTHEDDYFHGFSDLHTIRSEVKPVESDWKKILGPFAEQYGKFNFWNTNKY
jgi:sulfotransferase